MKMTRLEKCFVNRERKAQRNMAKVRERLEELKGRTITDALEIGCGIGTVAAHLADSYPMNVWGTDFDPEQVEIARKFHPEHERLHYRVEDAAKLSFGDESFDLVVSQNVFHHVPDWDQVVREIARVLRTGGYLIWMDLAIPGLLKALAAPFVRNYGVYTITDVRAAFERAHLVERFRERLAHGPMVQHHMVLEKAV